MHSRSTPVLTRKGAALKAAVAAVVVLVLWLLSSYALFYNPPLPKLQRADAVVVLGGASTERYPVGRGLVEDGWAPVLVLSHTDTPGNVDMDRVCNSRKSERIICFRPEPLTTRGEARAVARLADEHGWDTVLVVTSRYHVLRSYQHIGQCSEARLIMAASDPELGLFGWLPRFVEEGAGLAGGALRPVCANQI
ncbi:hypothetical protein GCM10027403_02720 [Arthrobacter tecti]